MKKLSLVAAVALAALSLSFKSQAQTNWSVDKVHSRLTFTITHLMVSDVEGTFKNFDATITAPAGADFTGAAVDFTANAASIATENDQRDAHVKSPDFLDVAKYPTMVFKSTSFTKAGSNTYKVAGNLTLHGVTKPVVLTAVVRTGNNPMNGNKPVAGFKITGTIKRSDFGIGVKFPEAVLSDEIAIAASAEFGKI